MDVLNKKDAEQEIQDTSSINHPESERKLEQFDLVYGKKLQSPILGHRYQLPDLPTNYVPSTILDTSLLHIPVYAHLKIYDLKPVQRPRTSSILSTLHLQFSEDIRKSSREVSSTARISEEDTTSVTYNVRNNTKAADEK